MAIYKVGQHITANSFNETTPSINMMTKMLDDGSEWARIYSLDVSKDATYFTSSNYLNCAMPNRFSALGQIDNFYTSQATLINLAPTINGTTGFNTGTAISAEGYAKYSSSALQLTGTTSTNEIYTTTSTASISLIAGHVYYVRVEIKQPSVVGSCQLYLGGTTAGSITEPSFFSGKKSIAGTWTKISQLATLDSKIPSGNHKLRLDFDNAKVAGTMTFDGLMVIDITAAFGTSFTPTAAWCDANIPYFQGTKTIDMSDIDFKKWEFMLTYPSLSSTLYNRWSQTESPNETAPGGYQRITTAWTSHAGPMRKSSGNTQYNCDNASGTTWFAAIGQTSAWSSTQAIPAADGSAQTKTELWVRIDGFSPIKQARIYKNNCITGGQIYEL